MDCTQPTGISPDCIQSVSKTAPQSAYTAKTSDELWSRFDVHSKSPSPVVSTYAGSSDISINALTRIDAPPAEPPERKI